MRIFLRFWLPVVIWMGLIFLFSTDTFSSQNTSWIIETIMRFIMPHPVPQKVDLLNGVARKCAHVMEYFILGLLLLRAFGGSMPKASPLRWSMLSLVVVIIYAAGDEFHQSMTSARQASIIDVGIDTIGGILSQLVGSAWRRIRRK